MAIPATDGVSAGCDNLQESHRDQSQTPLVWSRGHQWETVRPPPWETYVALDKSRMFQRVCGGKERGKKRMKERAVVEKPGVRRAPNAQKTALVRGAVWLCSTPLTRRFSQDFPHSY